MFDRLKSSISRFQKDIESNSSKSSPEELIPIPPESGPKNPPNSISHRVSSIAQGKIIFDQNNLSESLQNLELSLLSSDVELGVVDAIISSIKQDLIGTSRKITTGTKIHVESSLKKALLSVLTENKFNFKHFLSSTETPIVIIFIGVNGVGKTTTLAKFASLLDSHGYSSVLANGDTYRAGANEQLLSHSIALDKKLISHKQGGDPTAVLYDAVEYAKSNSIDVVLCDTAGRLHTNKDLMSQLEKINRVVSPDLTIFVDEAIAGQDAVNRARDFNTVAEIDGIVLTKSDADTSGGAAISIAHVLKKPILFLGCGQDYSDLYQFNPDTFINDLFN